MPNADELVARGIAELVVPEPPPTKSFDAPPADTMIRKGEVRRK